MKNYGQSADDYIPFKEMHNGILVVKYSNSLFPILDTEVLQSILAYDFYQENDCEIRRVMMAEQKSDVIHIIKELMKSYEISANELKE